MKTIEKCVAESIAHELMNIRHEDMSKKMIHSTPVECGSFSNPLAIEVKLEAIAMAWWCKITVSKQMDDGRVIDSAEFICGGINGPIRFDAIIEAIRDVISKYI